MYTKCTSNAKKYLITKKEDHTHSDEESLNEPEKMSALPQQSKSPTPSNDQNSKETNIKSDGSTPVAKRLRKRKVKLVCQDCPKEDYLLRSKEKLSSEKKEPVRHKRFKQLNMRNIGKDNLIKKKKKCSNRKNKPSRDSKLKKKDSFSNKKPNTQRKTKKLSAESVKRTDSSDSCDLPTFEPKRKPIMNERDKESFLKYGVLTPSVDEILKDQRDLVEYKTQVAALGQLCDKIIELPFSVEDLTRNPVNDTVVLDCKELSLEDISEQFRSNLDYISDIFHGRQYNERHDRYYSISHQDPTLTTEHLSYSTSMILFTFEQKEHILSLLEKEFDPKGNMTQYFFQVLLPELCLKIFMDIHNMSREDAVLYLDKRPVVGD